MNGLAPGVQQIFEKVSQLDCIKPFVLVGGTALSLQIGNRLSEDLDFMRWKTGAKDKLEVGWSSIKKELATIGTIENVDLLDLDMVLFTVNGVKISFYAAPRKRIPTMQEITIMNNLRVADIKSIGAMKIEIMSRRRKFRDYYDIYSILKEGVDIGELIPLAVQHSGNTLKTKNLLAILSNGERFLMDKNFGQLSPKYDVTATDIQYYISTAIARNRDNAVAQGIDSKQVP